MNFEYSTKVQGLINEVEAFMEAHVYPVENDYREYLRTTDTPFKTPPILGELREKAQQAGLWNLFFPRGHGIDDALTNLEYAPLAEIMGRIPWSSEAFNCNAPDTGNMETLAMYGTDEQKQRWLDPLLKGEIHSAFAMTEPDVASSDATNIACSITRDGDDYVINGRKWYTTGAMRDNCDLLILMGKTDPDNPSRHQQQSMILVPKAAAGVDIVRHLTTFGYDDAPYGEAEIQFNNVRVPASNLLLGEGRGFEIAQGRLGPGRIHHCMRLIGCAQRALELACQRSEARTTFGRTLSRHQSVREDIATMYCDIEQARLLTLKCAARMDAVGNKVARDLIAAIKITAPTMACNVIDKAIQIHGGAGLMQDYFLAEAYNYARQCRLADGPDQVHMMALGKQVIGQYV
ncbi:MAG: acyl-CoA dehydrogenase family protein [Pseudomonadota bacterium]